MSLTKWLRTQDAFSSAHQKDYWAQMLHEYLESQEDVAHHGGFVLTAQQCAAPSGDFDSGDLDAAPSAQQCAVPQGNASGEQQCSTPQGDSDFSHGTTAPAGALDNAPGAQQCAAPQGDFDGVMSEQQCGTPSGDFDSGDLDNVLALSQCAVARELLRFDYIASGKKTNPPAWLRRNYDDQGHYDALQNTTGIRHSRLDFVYSDFDTFSVNPLDPATWHAAPAAPAGDLDNAMNAQHCHAVPKGDQDGAQCAATYSVLFLYARKESDHPTDFQRVPHQILIH